MHNENDIIQSLGENSNCAYIHICQAKDVMYINQTALFYYVSSKGNQYLVALYKIDSNYTDCEPIEVRSTTNKGIPSIVAMTDCCQNSAYNQAHLVQGRCRRIQEFNKEIQQTSAIAIRKQKKKCCQMSNPNTQKSYAGHNNRHYPAFLMKF